jgi:HAD superfamily hydrolase (TIGR01509 family)
LKAAGRIRLIVFDMDGTITRPYIDFAAIRRVIGLEDAGTMILDFIQSLPPAEREKANAILNDFEEEAARNVEPQEGALEVLVKIRRLGIKTAIFTRNSRKSVEAVLKKLALTFDEIVTRDDAPAKPLKPHPEAILALMRKYGLEPEQALMVGDYTPDITAGKLAGIRTVLLDNRDGRPIEVEPDYRIHSLGELLGIVE